MDINTPIIKLSRVGATTAKNLTRLNILTAQDLLYWFPSRYEDFRNIVPISSLKDEMSVTVRGKLELIANKRSFRRRKIITEALVSDESGSIRVVWFNQPFIAKMLKPGDNIFLSGKVKSDMIGVEFISPTYEKDISGETAHTARLVPIYPVTHGITQKQMRFLIKQILPLSDKILEWLPEKILEKYDLMPIADALKGIHFPSEENELKASTERIKFDELFLVQLRAERIRLGRKSLRAPNIIFKEEKIKEFVSALPFSLTRAQKISAWEILKDLEKNIPMNRLLSGDVGSGKTVVAAIALYNTVLNNYQAVLMAPTEILARQHFDSLCNFFEGNLKIALLTRSQRVFAVKKESIKFELSKKEIEKQIFDGEVDIVVGTHALLSEKIKFSDVGLVVVDEQHRFGVGQRKAIKDKTNDISAHYLSMTATPIPRSFALMIYGDLDISILNEAPPGRKPVLTRLVESKNRDKAYQFIENQVLNGRQVFVVCPLIEKSKEKTTKDEIEIINYKGYPSILEKKSVTSEFEKLSKNIFPNLRLDFLHGKMKPADKEKVVDKFKKGKTDLLISTTVIEVGVDIPNASVMMIEDAERFGLAQLHQLRGRVGRSIHQSYCFVFTGSDSDKSLSRLKYFENISDGYKLAEKDLETRGPGEVYGVVQSGMMNFRLARLTDREIIKKARQAAESIGSTIDQYPKLEEKVADWEKLIHLE